jgi:hypothetical protein
MKEGKGEEGEEMKASGPTASPVLAPPPPSQTKKGLITRF